MMPLALTEAWWISAAKAFVIVNLVLVAFAYTTLLERKLLAKGCAAPDVASALERLRGAKLVDDGRSAVEFIQSRLRRAPQGRRRLRAELDRKGLPSEVIDRALAEVLPETESDLAREAYVIGGDQVLALGDTVLSKLDSMEAARRQMLDLSGKTHTLHTSVAVATNGQAIWTETTIATLTMRKLSPEFIGRYLAAAGEDVLGSVGVPLWTVIGTSFVGYLPITIVFVLLGSRLEEISPTDPVIWIGAAVVISLLLISRWALPRLAEERDTEATSP